MNYINEKKELAHYMQRLYDKNLTTSSGGNISIRNSDGLIFISESKIDKSTISEDNVSIVDINGKILSPEIKPSIEINMHLEIYKKRNDIFAIIHAHPVYTSIFAISNVKLLNNITDETEYVLGNIEVAEYEKAGSKNLAIYCSESLEKSDVAILKKHGTVCLGKTLYEAYNKVEILEFTAKVYYKSLIIGAKDI